MSCLCISVIAQSIRYGGAKNGLFQNMTEISCLIIIGLFTVTNFQTCSNLKL